MCLAVGLGRWCAIQKSVNTVFGINYIAAADISNNLVPLFSRLFFLLPSEASTCVSILPIMKLHLFTSSSFECLGCDQVANARR